jgi:Reverse transcriptase (RNA-dependent DNA polymerase)
MLLYLMAFSKVYPHRLIHLDIIPNAVLRHLRAYPVAHIHLDVFKAELLRLCDIGILEICGATQLVSPNFIIPKKDGTVRWVSDFRELNKVIQPHIYPLPRIQDILKCRPGYSYFSKLDVSMQYFTFALDKNSQNLRVIFTPFGLYKYKHLPMGIKQSSDIAQEVMENLFRDLDDVEVYIDNIGCFSSSFSTHVNTLDIILTRLEQNSFTMNPSKCEWAVKETDWLGYWLTPTGLKTMVKKN